MARVVVALACSLAARGALGVRVELDVDERQSTDDSAKSNISACAAVSQGVLQVHARCRESLADPSTFRRFPNLHAGWCDERLREIAHHHCDSTEQDRLHAASFAETELQRVTSLVGSSEEALVAEGAWEDCSGELHASSCTECESRHAGARERWATTHACEWKAGACVRSQRARPLRFDEAARGCGEDPRVVSGLPELSHEVASNRSATRRKKVALLVGITYQGANRLTGTYTDIKKIFTLLLRKGFEASNIFVLYDEGSPTDFKDKDGYSAQILPGSRRWGVNQGHDGWDGGAASFWEMANWVVGANRLSAGDHFFFYFSGHGAKTEPHSAPKELDGRDEWLATANLGRIMDNDFYDFLTQFPAGSTVTAIVDACHSEGFSDLPFNYMPGKSTKGMISGTRFEAQREWCTDWYKVPEVLPRARITFISGSQNHQTSADLGVRFGGALTMYLHDEWDQRIEGTKKRSNYLHRIEYAIGLSKDNNGGGGWERGSENSLYNRYKALSKFFKKRGFSQEPNICAFPSITDIEDFEPLDPPATPYGDSNYHIDYYPFVGGRRPGNERGMLVPPFCKHGGRKVRAAEVTKKAEAEGFLVKEELQVAPVPYKPGSPWEGWDAPLNGRLAPARGASGILFSERAPDVVRYVIPGSAGDRAAIYAGDIIQTVDGTPLAEIADKEGALARGGRLSLQSTRS